MAATPFEAHVRERDGLALIDLAGDIDAAAEEALEGAYDRAAALGPTGIVLACGSVGYINSTGIALIVSLLARARRDRIEMAAFGLADHYRHIFEITRLADFMQIFSDEETAVDGTTTTEKAR